MVLGSLGYFLVSLLFPEKIIFYFVVFAFAKYLYWMGESRRPLSAPVAVDL
jgi:hypothetical protein